MNKPSLEKARMVGGYLPHPLAEKLGVMALFKDVTRSDIIRSLLEEQLNKAPSTAEMLEKIAERLYLTWSQTIPLSEYLDIVTRHLESKKLSDGHVVYVLRAIEEIAKAEAQRKAEELTIETISQT